MNESALPALDDTLSAPTVHLDEAGERLVLHLDPELSVDEMETALRLLLDTRPDLRNRGLSLGFSDREVALFDLRRLTRLLAEDYGLTVAAVVVTERALLRYAQAELKVRLQVQSEERSWSMDTARPMPMAPVHPSGSAGCEDPAPTDAQEQVVAGAGPACSLHAPAEAAEEDPVCPADEAPRLQDEDEAAEEPEPTSDEAVPHAAAHTEPESGDGQASSEPAVEAVPVVVESEEADELLSEPVAAGRVQALHRTLRSGATVRHNGDLIVFGDVNAGAQVVADGNIVVLGALRGVAHAGARGDESASVVALDLQPTQVRIASHIALAPERPEATGSRLRTLLQRERPAERTVCPEVAQLRDGAIVFGPFRGRLPSAGRS